MDLTYLIPYEILQLVASYLLPKYQCRLALTSRWCYLYLYTDLLRWHARVAPIEVPRHKIVTTTYWSKQNISIIECNRKLLLVTHLFVYNICVLNYTKYTSHTISSFNNRNYITISNDIRDQLPEIYIKGVSIGAFDGLYRYMCRNIFVIHARTRLSPLLSLPVRVLSIILTMLTPDERTILTEISNYFRYISIHQQE